MRMMLRFSLPVEKGNQAFNDGSLGKAMESIMNKLKPEAAYFGVSEGKRGACCSLILRSRHRLLKPSNRFFSI
jgi:hypothetical protein